MINLLSKYRQEILDAKNGLLKNSQLITTSAGLIEVGTIGKGSPILISHGSGGGYDMGLWLGALINGPYQYIAPSRFGYLRSPVPTNSSSESQADIYAALLDALNITNVVIIGLSGGGASALQFALRYTDRCKGLIMISAISQPIPPLPRFVSMMYPLMLKSDILPWLLYTLSPQTVYRGNGISRELYALIKSDPEKLKFLNSLFQTTFPSTPRRDGMLNDINLMTNFTTTPINRITTPTLVIHAVNDPIVPIAAGEFTANTIPHAQFLKLEDGGHFVCATHREKTIPVIREFLIQIGFFN